jgi:hypothetical protein
MKRIAFLATTALFAAGATNAAEVTSIITDSVQMSVTPQVTISTPVTETYSVSGTGVTATTLGSVSNDGVGSYSVPSGTPPPNFQFTESYLPDSLSVTQTQTAGIPDKMTGSLSPTTGLATGTPGGPGSSIILQRSIELNVIQ